MRIHSHNEICGVVNLLYGSVLVIQAVCKGDGLGSMGVFITVETFHGELGFVSNSPMTEYFRFPSSMGMCIPPFVNTSKNKWCALHFAIMCGMSIGKQALDLMFQFR